MPHKPPVTVEGLLSAAQNVAAELPAAPEYVNGALVRLQLSQIITIENGAVTWRTGHLEHIANLFTGDPQTTERDYADDLAVARAYSADVWAGLIGGH